ncbi:MAG: hypothetical protein KUL75_08315 [Sterolibacterium sp.]|nr:hypothetical protein [Sterolibacterium sp.]
MSETDNDSSTTDPLLDQADALMRRRNFASSLNLGEARSLRPETADHETSAPSDEPDFPVLTDIVTPGHTAEAVTLARTDASPAHSGKVLEDWLEEVLPQMLANTLDQLGEQLLNTLRERARNELPARLGQPE